MTRHSTLGVAFVSVSREYLSQGGIHGLRYIIEAGNRVTERVIWVIVILLGLIAAGIMFCTLWADYVNNPTRTSVDTNYYPTWRLPFPALTLCNVNHIFRSKAAALVSKLDLPKHISTEEAMERLSMLVQLITPNSGSELAFTIEQIKEFQMILDNHHYTVRKLMRELGQSCDELLERCMWEGNIHNCSDLFEERKSFDGFCCSFNYRGLFESKMEDGKTLVVSDHYKERHTRYYGRKMGLTVLLNPAVHDYFAANNLSPGFRMIVHGSDDFPEDVAIVKFLPAGREMLTAVTPTSGYCTEAVGTLSPRQRKCVFESEKQLTYFPVYGQTNCIAECRTDYTVNYCNCSHFYYHDTGKIRLCDLKDIPCLRRYFCDYKFGFASAAYDDCPKHDSESFLHANRASLPPCDCPPLCNSVQYSVDVSSGDFQAAQFHITPLLTNNTNVTGRTLLHFYFSKGTSLRTRYYILNSWHELVVDIPQSSLATSPLITVTAKITITSSLGGIFSLFLGCSFISGIEVLYYFTLRLFVHLRHGQVSQSKSEQQPSNTTWSHRRIIRVVPVATHHFL